MTEPYISVSEIQAQPCDSCGATWVRCVQGWDDSDQHPQGVCCPRCHYTDTHEAGAARRAEISRRANTPPPRRRQTPPAETPASPTPPEGQTVRMTGSATVVLGRESHAPVRLPWSEFCAKLAALTEKVPSEKRPTVSIRYGTITVTWDETT